MEYKLLQGDSVEELSSAVNALLSEGWEPHGSPLVVPLPDGQGGGAIQFYQALVLVEDRE